MFLFYLPVIIVVAANVTYDISSKSIPEDLNAYAGLTTTYGVLAAFNIIVFQVLHPSASILSEWSHFNWAILLFAITSIGLESGYIFLYRAGWNISLGGMVCNTLLAVCMLFVGQTLFQEQVSAKQYFGVLLCIAGLIIVNRAGGNEQDPPSEPSVS